MIDKIDWAKIDGLLPVIIQDEREGIVLMLGYMNREALEKSLQEGLVTFFSRSKNRLWTKGERSSHFLRIKQIALDCDQDALIMMVEPLGPTCHRNSASCFDKKYSFFLDELSHTIDQRFESTSSDSYVQKLHKGGPSSMAQKVGEEGVEVAIASVEGNKDRIKEESADLLFHMLVNLRFHKIEFKEIIKILRGRVKS